MINCDASLITSKLLHGLVRSGRGSRDISFRTWTAQLITFMKTFSSTSTLPMLLSLGKAGWRREACACGIPHLPHLKKVHSHPLPPNHPPSLFRGENEQVGKSSVEFGTSSSPPSAAPATSSCAMRRPRRPSCPTSSAHPGRALKIGVGRVLGLVCVLVHARIATKPCGTARFSRRR